MASLGQLKHEYETRIKNLERALNAEESRRKQYGFFNKQLKAQVKKLQAENSGMQKELNAVKKCSSCECLDERRKQALTTDGSRLSVPAARSNLYASTGTLTPVDPGHSPEQEASREILFLRDSNETLKRSVETLNTNVHKLTQEKLREAAEFEKRLRERDLQINRLHAELEEARRSNMQGSQPSDERFNTLLLERRQLLEKIRALEERLTRPEDEQRFVSTPNACSSQPTTSKALCEFCRRRQSSWDNLIKRGETGETAPDGPSNFPVPSGSDLGQLQQEIQNLKERFKDQATEFEAERIRLIRSEVLLKDERDKLRNECQTYRRRCEALELELAKQRRSRSAQRSSSTGREKQVSSDSMSEESARSTIQHLQRELYKAHSRIEQLELPSRKHPSSNDLSALKREIDQLELDKRECESRLSAQNGLLRQLEEDINSLLTEKANCAKRCSELEATNARAARENDQLASRVQELRQRLAENEEMQDESARTHISQIEAYQQLLKQKDVERAALIQQFCGDDPSTSRLNSPGSNSHSSLGSETIRHFDLREIRNTKREVETLTKEREKLAGEMEQLRKEVGLVKKDLEDKKAELLSERDEKNKLAGDLEATKEIIGQKETELAQMKNEVQRLQERVLKLESDIQSMQNGLENEKVTSDQLRATIDGLEGMVTGKNAELSTLTFHLQRANDDIRRLKTANFDLDTELTLQSRELKSTRSKLERLKCKVKALERESRDSPLRVMSLSPLTRNGSASSRTVQETSTNTE